MLTWESGHGDPGETKAGGEGGDRDPQRPLTPRGWGATEGTGSSQLSFLIFLSSFPHLHKDTTTHTPDSWHLPVSSHNPCSFVPLTQGPFSVPAPASLWISLYIPFWFAAVSCRAVSSHFSPLSLTHTSASVLFQKSGYIVGLKLQAKSCYREELQPSMASRLSMIVIVEIPG